jgi:hypothetical protein
LLKPVIALHRAIGTWPLSARFTIALARRCDNPHLDVDIRVRIGNAHDSVVVVLAPKLIGTGTTLKPASVTIAMWVPVPSGQLPPATILSCCRFSRPDDLRCVIWWVKKGQKRIVRPASAR